MIAFPKTIFHWLIYLQSQSGWPSLSCSRMLFSSIKSQHCSPVCSQRLTSGIIRHILYHQVKIKMNTFMSPLRWRYLGAHPQMEMLLKHKEFKYVFLLIIHYITCSMSTLFCSCLENRREKTSAPFD